MIHVKVTMREMNEKTLRPTGNDVWQYERLMQEDVFDDDKWLKFYLEDLMFAMKKGVEDVK